MKWRCFGLGLGLLQGIALGHGGHSHQKGLVPELHASGDPRLVEINRAYVAAVRPIFQNSCFDCHSNQTRYPWYYRLPGVHGYMASDVTEGRRHMDMSSDFPFKGHGTPNEDLEAILKVVKENTMPPRGYSWLHRGTRLTPDNAQTISTWAQSALRTLATEKK